MAHQINILQIVNGFAIGGGELKLLELCRAICERRADKYNLVVCSVGQGGPLQPEFEKLGVKVYVFPKKHKFDLSLVFRVYRLIKRENIDLIQTTLFYADVIGAVAGYLAGVRAILSWETVSHPRESDEGKLRHKFAYWLTMKFTRKIIAVSEAIKNFVIKARHIPSHKVVTIHYGIDLSQWNKNNSFIDWRKRTELGFGKENIVIGTVARLTVQKGHRYLIAAAPQILEKFNNVHFVFVGDGPLRSFLQNQVTELGLEDRFHFLGFRQDVRELLYTFDLFVLPSLFEGLPNVLLEAMASYRPVVATAVDGTPEVVRNGENGILVPPRSPQALAEAIIGVLTLPDRGRSLGERGRWWIEQRFSFDKQFENFERLYDSALSLKRG